MRLMVIGAASMLLAACTGRAPQQNAVQENKPAPAAAAAAAPAPAPTEQNQSASADDGDEGDKVTVSGGADEATDDEDTASAAEPAPQSRPAAPRLRGCAAETSLASAREMVRICREVSPATHPPCNIENSCAMIGQEINRGCRMLGDDAPEDCRGG